jgi:hypothetical protein
MNTRALARVVLLVVQGFVAVTAVAGGVALVLGATIPALHTMLVPPDQYLQGTPFSGYLVPGILLAVVLGGIHILAFVALLRRWTGHVLLAACAAFATLIWIFVQMVFIPFSFLQAVYFVAGLAEAGLVMAMLGILSRRPATA